MKISDILAEGGKPFPSLEIVPPLKGMTKEELMDSIRPFMEFSPKYINVTCHRDEYEYREEADGTFSRHLVRRRVSETAVCGAIMSEFGIETVPHIICGGANADQIESLLHDLRFMGISNVMALRGDSVIGEKRFTPVPGGYRYAGELVAAIRRFESQYTGPAAESSAEGDSGNGPTGRSGPMVPNAGASHGRIFSIGVGGYPEKHFEAPNIETDIANLKKKVDAGADYIITQMFFDNRVFYDFVERCRAAGITVPIIPGLKPLSSVRQINMLPESFSLDIPIELTKAMLDTGGDKEKAYRTGTEWCIMQCRDLLKHGVPAVHFYTMGRSRNIVEILRAAF